LSADLAIAISRQGAKPLAFNSEPENQSNLKKNALSKHWLFFRGFPRKKAFFFKPSVEIARERGAHRLRQNRLMAVVGVAEAEHDLGVRGAEQIDLARREREMDELH
jgi:hypothetical protein